MHNLPNCLPNISRREFLVGVSCLCLCSTIPSRVLSLNDSEGAYVCSTHIPPLEGELKLQANAGDDEEIDLLRQEDEELDLSLQGAARSKLKWRVGDGQSAPQGVIRLGIGFVGDPPDAWKNEVIKRANNWLPAGSNIAKKIKFDFSIPLNDCDIRVRQTGIEGLAPSNLSKLGRLARNSRLSDGQSTMYIYNIDSVEHEFGHALCLTHEHFNNRLPITIDKEAAVSYYKKYHGWTRQQVLDNLFQTAERCVGDSGWNAKSVMGYYIPKEITVEKVAIYKNEGINRRDRNCLNAVYRV